MFFINPIPLQLLDGHVYISASTQTPVEYYFEMGGNLSVLFVLHEYTKIRLTNHRNLTFDLKLELGFGTAHVSGHSDVSNSLYSKNTNSSSLLPPLTHKYDSFWFDVLVVLNTNPANLSKWIITSSFHLSTWMKKAISYIKNEFKKIAHEIHEKWNKTKTEIHELKEKIKTHFTGLSPIIIYYLKLNM